MVKKKAKLTSREELLEIMNEHLATQQMFAEKLKNKAELYIDDGGTSSEDKKNRNSYLNAYNQQVDAVSRTTKTMMNIFNSSYSGENEEEDLSDSLVD